MQSISGEGSGQSGQQAPRAPQKNMLASSESEAATVARVKQGGNGGMESSGAVRGLGQCKDVAFFLDLKGSH